MRILLSGTIWLSVALWGLFLSGCATQERCERRWGTALKSELKVLETVRTAPLHIPERQHTWVLPDFAPCDTVVYERLIDAGPTQPSVRISRPVAGGPTVVTAKCPPVDTVFSYRPVEVVRTVPAAAPSPIKPFLIGALAGAAFILLLPVLSRGLRGLPV